MKDKHTVNLILVSLRWFNSFLPEFVHDINLSVRSCSSFVSRVPSSLNYLIQKRHLNHCKASSCSFQISFHWIILSYRSSSWRLYMVVHQGFNSFSKFSSRFLSELWSAMLYSKLNIVFNTCLVLSSSSILHLAFRSAILSTLSFAVVLCHSW